MHTVVRNFSNLFRRFKVATGLNIAGLTVAFAAFMVIMIQVKYEYSFDRFHPHSERIYRVDTNLEGVFGLAQSRPFIGEFIQSSPHIEAGGLIGAIPTNVYFYIDETADKVGFKENVMIIDPALVNVFGFPVIQGDPDCLEDPEKAIIPESLAKKLFGEEYPIGKSFRTDGYIWMKDAGYFTVGAVYKDFPGNTQLKNGIYMGIKKDFEIDNHYSHNYLCYVLLDSPESVSLVEDNFNSYYDFSEAVYGIYDPELMKVKLFPVTDIYYKNEDVGEWIVRTGNREVAFILIGIAFFVVIIAAINFTNFSTSLAPMRVKSINTQKVLGSPDRVLRFSLVAEAVILCIISCGLAFGLVHLLRQLPVLSFIEADLDLAANVPVLGLTFIISLVVGVVAGLYPAWYMTSFPPALVLKGSFGLSPKGRQLRTSLLGFQFVVSLVLIIVTCFVYLQREYMQNYTVGFDKDQIAIVELGEKVAVHNREAYVNGLKAYAGIEDVAFAGAAVGTEDVYSMNMFKYLGQDVIYFQVQVTDNFLPVMGIPLVEGREPKAAEKDTKFVFSRSVADKYGMEPGWYDLYDEKIEVTGLCEDISMTSLRHSDYNLALIYNESNWLLYSYVRLRAGTDYREAVKHIRATVKEIDPVYPVEVKFYDEYFNQLYKKEENLNKMISLFSLLAIVISIVGVFGLVVFETGYRKKEIGIRKVMGAEIRDILVMFNKTYFRVVTVCFFIAVPIAYYSVSRWLENFTGKTPLYWWVFLLAFLLVSGIVILTVTIQNWQAATSNPVDSVKSE